MGRRNHIAKDLYSLKYRKRIVKPKKGKGSFKRKKKIILILRNYTYTGELFKLFLLALKVEIIIKIKKGMQIKFIIFQLVKVKNKPADRLANAIVENTIKSLIPCTLNFSSSL